MSLTAFYFVSIVGCIMTVLNRPDFDCWVKFDSNEAFKYDQIMTQDENNCFNVTSAVINLCALGLFVLTIQFLLLIFANRHKYIACLAAFSFFPWLWFFVKVQLVRFSHSGEVCFGDLLARGNRSHASVPYMIKEGKFLMFLTVWQWVVIGLLIFGLIASVSVVGLEKYYRETEADQKVFAINALPRKSSNESDENENDKDQ